MNNLITVTVFIGKCTYHIEMQPKASEEEIISEIEAQQEIKNQTIKILKICSSN